MEENKANKVITVDLELNSEKIYEQLDELQEKADKLKNTLDEVSKLADNSKERGIIMNEKIKDFGPKEHIPKCSKQKYEVKEKAIEMILDELNSYNDNSSAKKLEILVKVYEAVK